ncbi:MAG: hypothetical protein Q6370_018845 [Candidatus Sigynarchaeota archaeon]
MNEAYLSKGNVGMLGIRAFLQTMAAFANPAEFSVPFGPHYLLDVLVENAATINGVSTSLLGLTPNTIHKVFDAQGHLDLKKTGGKGKSITYATILQDGLHVTWDAATRSVLVEHAYMLPGSSQVFHKTTRFGTLASSVQRIDYMDAAFETIIHENFFVHVPR